MAIRRYRYADFVHTNALGASGLTRTAFILVRDIRVLCASACKKWTHAEAQRTRRSKINKFAQIALPRHHSKAKITQGKRPDQGCTPLRRISHPEPFERLNTNGRGMCHFFYSAYLHARQIAARPNMLDLPRQPTY